MTKWQHLAAIKAEKNHDNIEAGMCRAWHRKGHGLTVVQFITQKIETGLRRERRDTTGRIYVY